MTLTPQVSVPCKHGHHPSHTITLAPTISLAGGIAAEKAMLDVATASHATNAERARALTYAWAPVFARHAAIDWDLCDENGDALPFDVEAILADYSLARLVADKAGDLGYGTAVMAPFAQTPEKPSRRTRTPATTSAPVELTQPPSE